jgi:hypothetical protein
MRRFASADLMDMLLQRGKITSQHIDKLAVTIASFHAGLPVADTASTFGAAETIHAAAMQNFEQLRLLLTEGADRKDIAALEVATAAEYAECRETFGLRRAQGCVRECHGDLHLGNIVLAGNQPVPFDCIEFNPALRWIDVMDEIAFSVMDLLHRNQPELAWRLLNGYLESSGDYSDMSVLRFYLAYRAAVRAKVCAIRSAQDGIPESARSKEMAACRSYLKLVRRCLQHHRPALIITHGLPGSGKTTFSQLALQQMGAIRIRSDVERKRLFGLGTLESSRTHCHDIYSAEATQRTYTRLLELAKAILAAGFSVIVDAAFLKQNERETFRQLARGMSVPFAIASLIAADNTLRERVRQRRNDASEADEAVLEMLRGKQQPLSPTERSCTARFTTEESPDSADNVQGWNKLSGILTSGAS